MSELVVEFADGQDGLVALAGLIRCYVDEQGWSSEPHHLDEIETLPGEYAAPQGRAFVVRDRESGPVGCVVLRSIAQWCPECVEMRRLYVIPQARGRGTARSLVASSETWARDAGYRRLRLVTLPHMTEAMTVYTSLGFNVIPRYRPSTAPDAIFMDKALD
jgi:GNAT superfamily N-acetyltransferase